MSDYIKREDAINEIKRFGGYIDDDMIYRINTAIFRIPSADVTENVRLSPITTVTDNKPTEWVEVVRCKECKWWTYEGEGATGIKYGVCQRGMISPMSDYCSYGEEEINECK